jgi:hypothetical protein
VPGANWLGGEAAVSFRRRVARPSVGPNVSRQTEPADPPVSFEEFRLYYESAERVTDRRLAMNRWNYSVSVAILIAIGGVLTWAVSKRSFAFVGVLGIVILCVMAWLLCTYWLRQIDDYKALNNAKFKILNDMAHRIAFSDDDGAEKAKSFRPFEQEWEILKEGRNLRKAPGGHIRNALVLSASGAEYFIPKAFRILFIAIAIVTVGFGLVSWRPITETISPFDGSSSSTSPVSTPSASVSSAPHKGG